MFTLPHNGLREIAWLAMALAAGFPCATLEAAPEAADGTFFEDSVASILKERCADCHNPDKRKGELDLSTPEGLLRGGENGAVFEAGEPEESHLYELTHKGEMPKKGDPLAADQLRAIHDWIAGGARFRVEPKVAEESIHQHDVLPIVLLRCTVCHGPRKQEGELDLRTPASMLVGGESGPALVAGDPDASLMIQRIESQACPPQEMLLKVFVKRPPTAEVETLREWIAAGAPVTDIEPDVATTEPDPLVSDEDRQHWAYQPPQVDRSEGAPDTIDEFIHRRLREKELTFSPEADRDTLIRRAHLDLIGLPPSPEEWKRWRESKDSDWYAAMIDHLLASPHYGERWGRYWLDLAGYADSEGGISADPVREVAWKYRDYVIDAFNADKPYDRFLVEQIAGDELVDVEKADVVTDEMVDSLVATGFLRMGIDQTGSRTMNFVPERLGVIADAINVLGGGVMGLTMDCVRCHSHKYDPIPHRDYYRLKAIFQGAFDEHDWLTFKTRSLDLATPDHRARVDEVNPPLEAEVKKLEAQLRKEEVRERLVTLRHYYPDQPESDNEATLAALKKADNTRTLTQKILVEKLQRAELLADQDPPAPVRDVRDSIGSIEVRIRELRAKMEAPLAIRAVWDRGEPSPTYILRRGEYNKPGRLVGPGVPSALTDGKTPFVAEPPFPEGTEKTGRRLAFARWLTRPDHPLTARVMVNRVWHHHFGTGLVKTLENFGVQGEAPSHPQLLDWLAVEFAGGGWSIKDLHRRIMNSRTYRQSSRISDASLAADPQNRLLSRMPLKRMDAEALRDSLLFVSGRLDPTPGGPPDEVEVDRDGLVEAVESLGGGWRRSVYLQYRRTEIPSMMATFDYPEMGPNCLVRSISTVSPQSLMLMNNEHVRGLAADLAQRVRSMIPAESGEDAGAMVDVVYRVALNRPPSDQERQLGIETLEELKGAWRAAADGPLETYCHTILNSAAFVYID